MLTIAFHTTVVVLMAIGLEAKTRVRVGAYMDARLRGIPAIIGRIAAVALVLAALHGLQAVAWALAYWWLGGFNSVADASIYSLATMTTFDIPGVTLPSRWRMLGALEAVNGALLFGISTAFLFAAIQVHWKLLSQRHDGSPDH